MESDKFERVSGIADVVVNKILQDVLRPYLRLLMAALFGMLMVPLAIWSMFGWWAAIPAVPLITIVLVVVLLLSVLWWGKKLANSMGSGIDPAHIDILLDDVTVPNSPFKALQLANRLRKGEAKEIFEAAKALAELGDAMD